MRLFLVLLAALAPAAGADLILHHARVYTVDEKFRIAEAVAVKGSRIALVGSNREVLAVRTASTRVVDLGGRAVLPGLIDSHVHPIGAGLSEFRRPLLPLDSYDAIRRFIREQAARTPKGAWIIVPRTFPTRIREMRMPTRDVLDAAAEHPVLFDASYVWIINSFALNMCGITRNTPNPPGGEIVKDERGEPNGILRNASSLVKNVGKSESFTPAERLEALERMLKLYVGAGLTAVGDRAVAPDDVALYEKLHAAGRLPLRCVLTWRLDASPPAEEVARRIRESTWTTGAGSDPAWLKFGAFKVTLDGGMTIGTAYQRYPYGAFGKQLYGQTDPDNRGQLFIAPAKLETLMAAAYDKGWQLTAHSQGGGAIDTLLEVFEKLDRQKPIAPTRSHLMHASFQSPEAIARLAKLRLPADVQAAWLYLDGPALSKVFPGAGMRYFFPLRTYRSHGIPLAGGSDHMIGHDKDRAVNPFNPFISMWIAVARRMISGEVLHPEERISREDALRMYTTWAAWLHFDEKSQGAIEPGRLADMVVIDRDYLRCPEDQIKDIQILTTVVDGKVAHRAAASPL